ncbi:MAG: hypothetical protein WCT01_00320 [Candidatus Shapirobacteria bacterium]
MTIDSPIDTQWFIQKATENDWTAIDDRVTEISNNPAWINWTSEGLISEVLYERDIAISLLEKTKLPFDESKEFGLRRVLQTDENQHLRRKSAIAFFVHGIKDEEILSLLHDAQHNDDELREQVVMLLTKL